METLLGDQELKGAPLVIFANKNDVPNAMKPHEIIAKLKLEELLGISRKYVKNYILHPCRWLVQSCSAVSGDVRCFFGRLTACIRDCIRAWNGL